MKFDEIQSTTPGIAKRLLAKCASALALVAFSAQASAAIELWDEDDYLVAHQAAIKVYDHDFTFKRVVYNGSFDVNSLAWTSDGLLRTAGDYTRSILDVKVEGENDYVAKRYRYLTSDWDWNMTYVGDMKIAPDGSIFLGNVGSAWEVLKFAVGPDNPASWIPVTAHATKVAQWSARNLHLGVAIVPDDQYGYVVWVGSESDVIRILKPDLSEVPFEPDGAVTEGDAQTVTSMYYDPHTHTVLGGRWFQHPTMAAVEIDVATRRVIRRFYLPDTVHTLFQINGITRGADGLVIGSDSARGMIHIWSADGAYLRGVPIRNTSTGYAYTGDRASGSILWAGNWVKPASANTIPSVSCPSGESFSCVPPSGTAATFSVVVDDPDSSQELTVTLKLNDQVVAEQRIPTPAQNLELSFTPHLGLGLNQLLVEVSDGQNSTSCSTEVIVNGDTAPPVLSGVPEDITVEAASPSGTAVNFALPSAWDDCDGTVPVSVTVEPGSIFPIGSTLVVCTAVDNAGNESMVGFTITVNPQAGPQAIVELDALLQTVESLRLAQRAKLKADLLLAKEHLQSGEPALAEAALVRFEKNLAKLVKQKHLSSTVADALIAASRAIRDAI